jgi:AsmA protein
MGDFLKLVLKIVLSLLAIGVLLAISLVFLTNPNQYKSTLEQAVLDNTGYQLNIAGDLDLVFRPYFGITLNDVRLRNPNSPQELASTSAISLRADLGALIRGQLLVKEFSASDFHVNSYINSDGHSIWDLTAPLDRGTSNTSAGNQANANRSSGASENDAESDSLVVAFEQISIENASIDIQNIEQGYRYLIANLNFSSSDSNLEGRPFPIDTNFELNSNSTDESQSFGFNTTAQVDLENGTAELDEINFSLTPMLLQGGITVSGLNDAMTFNGNLQSNQFNIFDLLDSLNITEQDQTALALPGVNTDTDQQLSLAIDFSGDETQFLLTELIANLGNMQLEANANIRYANEFLPTNISYDVSTNALDLSSLFPEEEAVEEENALGSDSQENQFTAAMAPRQAAEADIEIPVELLNDINMLGSIYIESLALDGRQFNNINLFTNLESGVLDIETQTIDAFGGQIQGNIRLDGRSAESTLTTQLSLQQLNIVDLALTREDLNAITGRLDVEVDYTANGNTVNDLINTLSGSTVFAINENSVDIGVIKQVFTAITALSPTGDGIQQWPDIMQFSDFSGYILLNEGIKQDQQIKLRMDNFDLSGTGGLDLSDSSFDYQLAFTLLGEPHLQTIQIDERYHNVSWPVQCAAMIEDEVIQYCRPDFTEVREIFAQMGRNEIERRLDDTITDQVPEQLQDTARGLLRSLLN